MHHQSEHLVPPIDVRLYFVEPVRDGLLQLFLGTHPRHSGLLFSNLAAHGKGVSAGPTLVQMLDYRDWAFLHQPRAGRG